MQAALSIDVEERRNAGSAELSRELLKVMNVAAISLFGAPGCGKTTLLIETLKRLSGHARIGVIIGNVRADRDAERVRPWCSQVIGIETIDLDASMVREALQRLDLSRLDLVLIERASAVPPTPVDLGQTAAVGLFSVCGGDDKLERYAQRVRNADVVVLSKTDLLSQVAFDPGLFRMSLRKISPATRVIEASAVLPHGMDQWCNWVRQQVRRAPAPEGSFAEYASCDYFIG